MDVAALQQLRKLSEAAPPEESLGQVLETLWSTRKTGLSPQQKPTVHSLLNLTSVRELEPVLACLRSIIRRTLDENLYDDNIRMLFPVDISEGLQSNLVLLLNKYRDRWKEEASRDQPISQQIRQDSMMNPPALTSTQASNSSLVLSSQKYSSTVQHNCSHFEEHTDLNVPRMTSVSPQQLKKVVWPELKSMTWMVENRTAVPANRVAVINLKLQDNTKCPSEKEIKFCLSKDTLEAMLRSMTYISEQLSKYQGKRP